MDDKLTQQSSRLAAPADKRPDPQPAVVAAAARPALEEEAPWRRPSLGQTHLEFSYAAELEKRGRDEDDIAFARRPRLAELPAVESSRTVILTPLMRQFFFSIRGTTSSC
jgi:hypothetical protein